MILLLIVPILHSPAQTNTSAAASTTSRLPQWVRDLRRWEIVAFGTFPFSMFTVTFITDMYRWSQANGMDFSNEGRRYAPWPLKSAGAIAMDSWEIERTITIAACLSVAIAVTDLIIVQIKRHKERKRVEALPVGTTIITRTPWGEEESELTDDIAPDDETAIVPDETSPEIP